MRLSVRSFILVLAAIFSVSCVVAFFFTRQHALLPALTDAGSGASPASSGSRAEPESVPPFETTADRVTLGSGIEPEPQTGSLQEVHAKLQQLAALPDGPEKLQLAHEVGGIRDRSAIPVLLDWATITTDRALLRAALDALGPMAAEDTIEDMRRRYAAAFRADDRYRLAKVLRNVTNPDAEPVLIALAESPDVPPQLAVAATEALATIGTPNALSCLLGRLQVADPDDTARLATAIARIDQPAALAALRFAALGNKDAATDAARAAAVQALANFRDEETRAVLTRLSEDPSELVSSAARSSSQQSR